MINKILSSHWTLNPFNASKTALKGSFAHVATNPISFTGQDVFVRTKLEPEEPELEVLKNVLYTDPFIFASFFHEKLEDELMVPKESDIVETVQRLSEETGWEESKIYKLMGVLSEFSSYENMYKMGNWMRANNVSEIYDPFANIGKEGAIGVNYNRALKYAGKKCLQLCESGSNFFNGFGCSGHKKMAFVIDNNSIEQLQRLKEVDPKRFERIKNNLLGKSVVMFIPRGSDVKVGDKYYSTDAIGKNIELEELAKKMLQSNHDGVSNANVLQKDIADKMKELLGEDVKIHVMTNKRMENSSSEGIKELNSPVMPSERALRRITDFFSIYFDQNIANSKEAKKEDAILRKYLYEMCCAESPESMRKKLVDIYNQVENIVEWQGKTMDDVLYIIPEAGKSYDLINYQYQKINNVPWDKFITINENKIPDGLDIKGKTLVILDDFIGSGESSTKEPFNYKNFIEDYGDKNVSIVFASIISLKEGREAVEWNIKCLDRKEKDFVVTTRESSYPDFVRDMEVEEEAIMNRIIGDFGYEGGSSFVVFPYGQPDNNSALGSVVSSLFVKNEDSVRRHISGISPFAANCIKQIFVNEDN